MRHEQKHKNSNKRPKTKNAKTGENRMHDKEEYIDRFRTEINLKGYSKNTLDSYIYTIQRFMNFTKKTPEETTEEDIKKYLVYLQQGTGATGTTIHRHLNAIRSFFRINNSSAAENIDLPKIAKKLPEFLSVEETKKLLSSIENLRDRSIIQLLYACGIRVSELVNLNRENIEENAIKIIRGKGSKDRIVYADEGTLKRIKAYLKTRNDMEKALFINTKKDRLTQRSVQRIVKHYADVSGMTKNVTPHTLRHSFATHLLQNDADIMIIKELLGHSNLSTTQIYMHVTNKRKESVYNRAHPLSSKKN
ncbi:MAG: tyrosine-type recombinase/integrase [Candidatus Aenigmarchaeota archaeon]|nr:tyrosine-type recombinase/integrase [Candidatus Aenigmarchaeota archaeon]